MFVNIIVVFTCNQSRQVSTAIWFTKSSVVCRTNLIRTDACYDLCNLHGSCTGGQGTKGQTYAPMCTLTSIRLPGQYFQERKLTVL